MDDLLPKRLRDNVIIRAGERHVVAALRRALDLLADETRAHLVAHNYASVPAPLQLSGWVNALDNDVLPALASVYGRAYDEQVSVVAAISENAQRNAEVFLRTIRNLLIGIATRTFRRLRVELRLGVEAGESIPELAARVDAVLNAAGENNWRNRAVTVARTEVVRSFNAGRIQAGRALARAVGVPERDVQKTWLATHDHRTRPTHVEADGQSTTLNRKFRVGNSLARFPGDPMLPPGESVNCRCTVLIRLPGDPGYSLTAGLEFTYNPAQKRGRDGRWIKYLFGAKALLEAFRPRSATSIDQTMLAGARGRQYRDYKRGKKPGGLLELELSLLDDDVQRALDNAPPTPENALVWYRPNLWYRDPDFPEPQIGDVITDDAPLTAEMERPPATAPLKYAIRIPKGTERVLPIPPLGQYKADKGGVLIGDGHQYKVAEILTDEKGRKTVVMDLLEPDEQVAVPGTVTREVPDPWGGPPMIVPDDEQARALEDLRRRLMEPTVPESVPQPLPIEDVPGPEPALEPLPEGLRRNPPSAEVLESWKKVPTPEEVEAAKKRIGASGTNRGTYATAALLDAAGYNAKPTVLAPADFDAFKGKKLMYFDERKPRETFIRAGYGDKMYDNITADPEYYIGRGIFGNGTFMGNDYTANSFGAFPQGSVKRTQRVTGSGGSYYGRGGTREAVRMKIHPDAKVVDWPDVPPIVQEHARYGQGDDPNSLEAWAVRNGVDIVNTSFGQGDPLAGVNVLNRAVLIVEELV